MTNTAEHLEHIEHNQHAAHSRFDRNVAMTMAIVAAVLACLTMFGHRASTETLRAQLDASITKTAANDQWGYYQAKNTRKYLFRGLQGLDAAAVKDPGLKADTPRNQAYEAARKEWADQLDKYVQKDLPQHQEEAEELDRRAKELAEKSHHAHERANRFELGELFVELALVFCSLAVLTKRAPFWFVGIATGSVGVVVGLSVLLMHF